MRLFARFTPPLGSNKPFPDPVLSRGFKTHAATEREQSGMGSIRRRLFARVSETAGVKAMGNISRRVQIRHGRIESAILSEVV